MTRHLNTLALALLLCFIAPRHAYHPRLAKGVLLWQVQLSPDQCGSPKWTPCYNVYAVNETHGDLVWFAFTTSSAAVKGMHLGRHSVYYSTWSGPGLYAVNPTNGHVRWQFPLDNWFRYWVKDIDLDRSASFGTSAEVRDVVFVTAAGPPARLYGVSTRGGSRQWEYKLSAASAALAGLAGPLEDSKGHSSTLFMAVNQPSSNSSWVQALGVGSGRPVWQSAALNDTALDGLELQASDRVLLAATAAGDGVLALDAANGSLLWRRSTPEGFCRPPSLAADVYKGQLLLSDSCVDLSGLSAVDVVTGEELWSGWDAPGAAQPAGGCSAHSQAAGSILFGCRCHAKARWHWQESTTAAAAAASSSRRSAAQQGTGDLEEADRAQTPNAVCMYALSSSSGKLRWVLPLLGNASFPEGAQQWGMGPVVTNSMALFLAADRVIGVDLLSGKLRWVLPLPRGEVLRASELPVVDADSGTLVLAAQVLGSNKTGLSGVSLREGRLLWHKTVNGTLQRGVGPSPEGPQRLTLAGGRVFVEACRGSRCCLRALNVTTGKQRWGMCLDAVQGDDATHPHAQFAIWFVTLLAIASIALLVLGAGLVYVQRWREERRILYGAAAPGSPRHSYQPLPPRDPASDSDG